MLSMKCFSPRSIKLLSMGSFTHVSKESFSWKLPLSLYSTYYIKLMKTVYILKDNGLGTLRCLCSGISDQTDCTLPAINVGAKVIVTETISKEKVELFAKASGDWNPVHFGSEENSLHQTNSNESSDLQRKGSAGRAPIVHGALLNGIVSGVIGTKLPGPGTLLVSQTLNYSAGLPVGSKVEVEVEVIGCKRREVNVEYKVVSCIDGSVVMSGQARLMVPKGRIRKPG